MPRINMANIQSALGKVKDAAAPLQNQGHTENVPVEYIHPSSRNIFNETDTDESIKELADDIAACGLEHPIAVNKIASDNYRIISGERRYRAMTEYLHRKTIPCMVFENLSEDQEQLRLFMANLSVREYTASQKYRFYLEVKTLLEKMKASGEYKGGMQKGIAELLNVTERQVKKYYQLEKLPEEIQRDVLDGKISINKALETAQKDKEQTPSKSLTEAALTTLIGQLSESQREMLLNGQVKITKLFTFSSEVPERGEPVPLLEASKKEITEANRIQKTNIRHNGSVLIFKDGVFIPNKVQILEEHESYTVFKVFAVKQ